MGLFENKTKEELEATATKEAAEAAAAQVVAEQSAKIARQEAEEAVAARAAADAATGAPNPADVKWTAYLGNQGWPSTTPRPAGWGE